jgi:hypothetical protein
MDAFSRNAIALGNKYHGNIWNILVRSLASKASKQKSPKNIVDPSSGKGQTQELLEALAPRTDRVELSEEELADAAVRCVFGCLLTLFCNKNISLCVIQLDGAIAIVQSKGI